MPDEWANPHLLVDDRWLADRLGDPAVVLVDCDQLPAYQRLHIPGAVWSRSRYWKGDGNDTDIHAMDDPARFAAEIGRMGIANDSTVVAYDASGGLYAARLWWTLDRFGFQHCGVLDGGLDAWYAAGRPLSRENVRPEPRTFHAQPPQDRWMCHLPDVVAAIDDPQHVFWDTRSDAEWTGENKRGTQRGGRIPGAVHLEWLDTLNEPVRTLKPPDELRRMLHERGITPDQTVTTY